MSRGDWNKAIQTPIAQIPCGRGHALALSAAYLANECFEHLNAEKFARQTAFNLTKAIACPIDVMAFQMEHEVYYYATVKFEWALLGDVDAACLDNKVLRDFRFKLKMLCHIKHMRAYRAKLSFLVHDDREEYTPKTKSIQILKNHQHKAPLSHSASMPLLASKCGSDVAKLK